MTSARYSPVCGQVTWLATWQLENTNQGEQSEPLLACTCILHPGIYTYLKVFVEGRINTQSSHQTAQLATKRKFSDDRTGALGEGPDGVAIRGQYFLSLSVGWALSQITTYNVA